MQPKIVLERNKPLPEEFLTILKDDWGNNNLDELEEILELGYDGIEEVIVDEICNRKVTNDSDYYYNDYEWILGDYRLEAYGSQYIKDQSICDEEMADHMNLYYIPDEKIYNANKKAAKVKASDDKWNDLLEGIDMDEHQQSMLFEVLKHYNFPKKIDRNGN